MACVQGLDASTGQSISGRSLSLFSRATHCIHDCTRRTVEPLTMARTLMDGHTASITQLTLAKFLEGHFGSYVRMMRSVYVTRRDKLASLMTLITRLHVVIAMQQRVACRCLAISGRISEEEIAVAARRAGVSNRWAYRIICRKPCIHRVLDGVCRLHQR